MFQRHALQNDPLNESWDAVVTGSLVPENASQAEDARILRRFQALDGAPAPDHAFVDRLARQLQTMERPRPGLHITVASSLASVSPPANRSSQHRSPSNRKWFAAPASALLAVALIGSLFTGYWFHSERANEPEAIPAVIDQMAQATTAEGGLSDALSSPAAFEGVVSAGDFGVATQDTWNRMMLSLFVFLPGDSIDTVQPWFTAADGIALLHLVSGTLDVLPGGTAKLVPMNSGGEALSVVAGSSLTMNAGDTIIFSIADGVEAVDSTELPAVAVHGLVGADPTTPAGAAPTMVDDSAYLQWNQLAGQLPSNPSSRARVAFERIALNPGGQSVREVEANQPLLGFGVDTDTQMRDGRFQILMGDAGATPPAKGSAVEIEKIDTSLLHTDAITLVNANPTPIFIYLMSIEYLP